MLAKSLCKHFLYRLTDFVANLFRKLHIKFHQNCISFMGDTRKNILVSFVSGHTVDKTQHKPRKLTLIQTKPWFSQSPFTTPGQETQLAYFYNRIWRKECERQVSGLAGR